MKTMLFVAVLLCSLAFGMQADAAGLPVESAGMVYVMPTSAEPGFTGGLLTVGLPIPQNWKVGDLAMVDLLKGAVVLQKTGVGIDLDELKFYPGAALALQGDIGVPTYVGICYLPTVRYKTAIFAGVQLLSWEF